METAGNPEYSGLVPMLPVTDVARTIAFYEQLGFGVGDAFTPEGASAPVWAWLQNGQAHLMISRTEQLLEATHDGPSIWLYSADVEATHALLGARGLDVGEIGYPFYNPRGEFHVHDPDGYAVFIAAYESPHLR